MPVTSLLTERLRLEPWRPAHGGMLARLSAMPEMMRLIGRGEPWTAAEAEEHSARVLVHWRRHGFGWRAAVERDSGRAVGMVALELTAGVPGLDDGEHEIGWWLDPAMWGRGYATEGGRAIVDEAFGRVGAPSVVARIQIGNPPPSAPRRWGWSRSARPAGTATSNPAPAQGLTAASPTTRIGDR